MIYKTICNSIISSILIFSVSGCSSYKNVNMYQKENQLKNNEQNLLESSLRLRDAINENENTSNQNIYNEYPNKILKRLLDDDKLHYPKDINFNVKIIKNPTLNAFALPNGSIYIHSGILAKLENEAQLALLIGHEMSHVIYKHSLKQKENNKTNATVLQIFGAFTMPFDAGLLSLVLYSSSISGYSIENENQADIEGYKQIVNAGYDPKKASRLFDILLEDIKLNKIKQPYFFSTHPRVEERIKNSKKIISDKYSGIKGEVNQKVFYDYLKPIVVENIETDLKLKRFESAKSTIKKLKDIKVSKNTINYLEAETLRLERKDDYISKSLNKYMLVIKEDKNNSKAYRGLGYLYYKDNKKNKAKKAFKKYLALNKEAKDKAYIMHYIKQCEEKEKNEKIN